MFGVFTLALAFSFYFLFGFPPLFFGKLQWDFRAHEFVIRYSVQNTHKMCDYDDNDKENNFKWIFK